MTNAQTNPFYSQHEDTPFCSCNTCLPFEVHTVEQNYKQEWEDLMVEVADEAYENSKRCDYCDSETKNLTFVETYQFTGYVCTECREHEIKQ